MRVCVWRETIAHVCLLYISPARSHTVCVCVCVCMCAVLVDGCLLVEQKADKSIYGHLPSCVCADSLNVESPATQLYGSTRRRRFANIYMYEESTYSSDKTATLSALLFSMKCLTRTTNGCDCFFFILY